MSLQLNAQRKDATEITKAYNRKLLNEMNSEYHQIELEDVEYIKQHLILEFGEEDVVDADGTLLFDSSEFQREKTGDFPDTVNPYLWQSRKDNEIAGVIQLAEGYYVVTGVDVSLIGFIRTKHGWIIQDCGNYIKNARIALRLVEKALGENVRDHIAALIISHTHLDHYGGVEAFVTKEQVGTLEEGKIPIIAPGKYEQSLIDDNLYAGIAMSRRLQYQGGMFLPKDEKGNVGVGLNQSLKIGGEMSFVLPTVYIEQDQTLEIDGVKVDFILSPNTETRAHMCSYYHQYHVLFLGDNAMGTLHNTYTMRGARVRDANFWGELFYRLYVSYGDEVKAVFQGHGVPHIKQKNRPDNLKKYLLDHAAAYKYTSDQALLMANKGYNLTQIGRELEIPEAIQRTWYIRPHYGHYSFNARGAYQRYLGFYDGNPVHLLPLEAQEMAKKIVEYTGSVEQVLQNAKRDYEKGEYQWVATVTNYLVFLDPQNLDARYLCADALEQLGYQAESGLWRNAYLSGAFELRNPKAAENREIRYMDNRDVMPYVSAELILDHMGINFDGSEVPDLDKHFWIKVLSDKKEGKEEYHQIHIYKGTLLHAEMTSNDIKPEDTVVVVTQTELYLLSVRQYDRKRRQEDERAEQILDLLETYIVDTSKYRNFNLIEPLAVEGI